MYAPTNRLSPYFNPLFSSQPKLSCRVLLSFLKLADKNQNLQDMKSLRNVFLGSGSQISIWVGIKCFQNGEPKRVPHWWMEVYCRASLVGQSVNAQSPPHCLEQPLDNYPYEYILTPRRGVCRIPTWVLHTADSPTTPPVTCYRTISPGS